MKVTRKLAKWVRKAEEAANRAQAQKALRKVRKWSRRLNELYDSHPTQEEQ